jgi:hypothetical protein
MLVRDERRPARLEVPTRDLVLRDAALGKQRRALVALGTFAQRTLQKGGSALRSASRRKATLALGGEATWPLSRRKDAPGVQRSTGADAGDAGCVRSPAHRATAQG